MPYPEGSPAGRLLANDAEVLEQVVRWISITLTSPCFWRLRREWPDLVQEALTRVVESLRLGRFDSSRDLRVYVQGTARLVGLQTMSRHAQSPSSGLPDGLSERDAADPEAHVIDRQLARRVLDLSSEDCRELFRLYYFEAQNYQEIAGALDLPVGTVKSRLFRCLESAHHAILTATTRHRDRERSSQGEATGPAGNPPRRGSNIGRGIERE